MALNESSRGASLNRHTTHETWSSHISTRASASRASASSAASVTMPWWRPTRPRWRRRSRPTPRCGTSRGLAGAGGRGRYGWYEALDYTPARLPEGETVAIVRAYMAHHQGMTVVALANALHRGLMPARFHAEPIVQATELLLQERAPRDVDAAILPTRVAEGHLRSRARPADAPALLLSAPADPAHAAAFQWAVLGDDDRRRIRIQPLG